MSRAPHEQKTTPAPRRQPAARPRCSTAIRVLLEAGVPQRLAWRQRFGMQLLRPAWVAALPGAGEGPAR